MDPKNKIAHHNKGISLHHLKKFEEAIRCFNTAIEFDPSY